MIERTFGAVIFLIGCITVFAVFGFAATFIPDDDGRTNMSRVVYIGIFAIGLLARQRFWTAVNLIDSARPARRASEPDADEGSAG